MIVQVTDFESGIYRIPTTQYTVGRLTDAIDKYESIYLAYLLGVELSELFIADLVNGIPVTQKYIDIYDKFIKEINCNIENSIGIKNMLIGFIYYEIMIDKNYQVTEGGNVTSSKENSTLLDFQNNSRVAEKVYNESKFTADSIQKFICKNMDIYIEFRGQEISIKFNALL